MYLVNGRLYTGSAPCFCCGKDVGIDERRIQWLGETEILLHVPCALKLVAGLTADLVKAEHTPLHQFLSPEAEGFTKAFEKIRLRDGLARALEWAGSK